MNKHTEQKQMRTMRIHAMQSRIPYNAQLPRRFSAAFSDKLVHVMCVRGLSMNELKEIIGVDRRVVKSWLSGDVVPHTYNLARLCAALKVDANWMIGLSDGDDDE